MIEVTAAVFLGYGVGLWRGYVNQGREGRGALVSTSI